MLIIDMPKKYLTDASGFVSCTMCKKYLPLLYRDCNNDFKGCLIKGELHDEHGDLVDADTVLWEVDDADGIYPPMPVTISDIIEAYDVPVIIKAERKDDE